MASILEDDALDFGILREDIGAGKKPKYFGVRNKHGIDHVVDPENAARTKRELTSDVEKFLAQGNEITVIDNPVNDIERRGRVEVHAVYN